MASAMMDTVEKQLNDSSKPWTQWFALAEAKTGVKRLYLFGGAVAVVAIWLVFGFAGQLLCNCISFVYPAYASMKAIETPQKGDDTKWLTYWTVFAAFSLVEFFSDIIVGWLPFYWLLKCIFFIWCFAPLENNGSVIIYNRVIRRYFLKFEGRVDSALNEIKEQASKVVKNNLFEEKRD